ncbi:hypothetical protein [Parachlamydia sp. AcF125]|uniref:hypothetical protein n=1 Tax=Parachlamydia sp. AcF125 TaxID=2795736 RepID=UPI001BC90E47|nr:hypothetical protein [Parachlamydia sp. AcF125]MBS4168091.1 hypothetical protein [Parachlamydia sp. AcF125]
MPVTGSDANLDPLSSPLVDPYYDSTIQPSTTTSKKVSSSTDTLLDTLSSAAATTQSSSLVLVGPSGSPLLPTPSSHVALSTYTETIQAALREFKEAVQLAETQDYLQDKDRYLENAATAQALLALYKTLVVFSRAIQSLVNQENDTIADLNAAAAQLNSVIQAGRAEDANQINLMNQATAAYQAGGSAKDYNAAVAAYNSYLETRNAQLASAQSTYNAAVDTYNARVAQNNAQLADLNAQAAALGITLSLKDQSTTSYVSAEMPTVTNPPSYLSLPTSGVAMLPSITNADTESSILTTYYQPAVTAALTLITTSNHQMDLNQAYLELQYYYLAGTEPYLPNAYIQQNRENLTGNSTTSSAGSALTVLGSSTQTSPSTARVLSDALYKSATLQDSQPLSPNLYDQLVLNTIQLLGQVSTYASLPATNALAQSKGLIPPTSPAVGLSVGYGIVQQVVSSLSSEAYKTALGGLISANGSEAGISDQGIAQAQRVLTATTNLAILQIALVQAAMSMQSPGLVSQFLSNLENLPANSALLASSSKGTLASDLLQDPLSLSLLSSAIAANSSEANVNVQTVSTALSNVQNQGVNVNNSSALQQALIQEFQKAGLSSQQAEDLAALTLAELSGSANLPFLNGVLSGAIASANLPISTLAANLNSGVNQGTIEQAVQSALAKASGPDSFQIALNTALGQAGFSSETAASLSRTLTIALAESAFTEALSANLVNLNLLQASLAQGLQTENADTQASQAITAAIHGGRSLRSVSDLQNALQEELVNQGISQEEAQAAAQAAIVDYLNPEDNPLESGSLGEALQPQALAQQVFSRVFGLASPDLGSSSAQKLAANYTLALLGLSTVGELTEQESQSATSLLSLFKEQLGALSSEGQSAILAEWASQMRDLTNPNLELAQFLSQIKQPATVLLSTAIPSMGMQQLERPIDSLQV